MKTITAFRTTYYHIAAQELGDATQFSLLMSFNNVTDPVIYAPTGVNIPDVTAASNNGLHPLAVNEIVTLPSVSS